MGVSCKPTGKMRSILKKVENQQLKELKDKKSAPKKKGKTEDPA